MLLLLKKIRKTVYVGAIIGFLAYLLNEFIPGLDFLISLPLNLQYILMSWWTWVYLFIIAPLIFILLGAFIGFIISKLKKQNDK